MIPRRLKRELLEAVEKEPLDEMSARVIAIQYEHVEDGKNYSHDFDEGVNMVAVGSGFIVLVRRDGKPLSREFIT